MTIVAIPSWTPNGVLPPVNPQDPVGAERSPYEVSPVDLVLRFSTSPERRQILSGLLSLRGKLYEFGIKDGFQWIDGSFLENIELIENRPPRDVDVVSFVTVPAVMASGETDSSIFDHDQVKKEYLVDHYFVELNLPSRQLISWATYWAGLWSHQRSMKWKGFLQVELNPDLDLIAAENLKTREIEEAAE